MKPIKLLLASLLVGASAATFSACGMLEKLPTWLGGMGDAYTVTIKINGEEQTVKIAEDAIPEKPADPVREGYDFKGWYLDEACTQEYKFDKPLNADSTLYAYFTEKEYVVTFVVDGVAEEVTFKWSETPTYATPKKNNYVFKNWCLDEACTQDYTFATPVRSPLTVYAKFVEAYKVEYVVSPDGESTENNEIVETEKETAPIRPADPNVEGYNFEGWYLDEAFTLEYNFNIVLDPETKIYAKLVEKEYTVTYMAVGPESSDEIGVETYKYWTAPVAPETPTHNGEYFFGWYLDEAFTNSYDFSYTLKEDTTVYAQFLESKPIYTVEELKAIADYPSGNYQLQNNITLKRNTWAPITEFSGKFDGNGYKIYDFTIDTTSADSGFFVTNNGTIKNLTLENFIFTSNHGGNSNVGALVGVNNGTVENCNIINPKTNNNNGITYKNHISVTSGEYRAYYGGMIGKNTATGIVKNCDVIADMVYDGYLDARDSGDGSQRNVYMYAYVGGAIGYNQGEVSNVSTTFKLSRKIDSTGNKGYTSAAYGADDWGSYDDYAYAYLYVGGVVSGNLGAIEKSGATIDVEVCNYINNSTFASAEAYIGGVVFANVGTVKESFAKGSILNGGNDDTYIGGFAYWNEGAIYDCYSDVEITTNGCKGKIGGFVAINVAQINRCYAMGSISSTSTNNYVGGFVGYSETNAQIKNSFTTVDITAANTYLGAFVGGFAVEGSAFSWCWYSSDAVVMKGETAYTSTTVTGVNPAPTATMFTQAFLADCYWNDPENGEAVWNIDGVNAPSLLWEQAE